MASSGHRARYREIAAILSRHGFGYIVDRLEREPSSTGPEHLRLVLEELGVAFVKLGQLLSTRSDLLPPEYVAELGKLQDGVLPLSSETVRAVVSEELGEHFQEVFSSFDEEPLAAGSIGQAHAAVLRDGTEVVVKIRRPGVVEHVQQDLEIFQNLATRAARRSRLAAEYDVVGLAEEFARTLRGELDYLAEGRNADRFASSLAGDPDVLVPRLYWDATTSRMLTLGRVRGVKIDDVVALEAARVDGHDLAERATRLTAQMVFGNGFFHADPHPGNLFIQADGRIGLIDFGMVGSLDDRVRLRLGRLLVAFIHRDVDRLADALLALGASYRAVDREAFTADLRLLLARYEGVGIGEISLIGVIDEALVIVRRHRLQLPREIVLLVRVLVIDQGVAARFAPDFQVQTALAPYAERLMIRQFAPGLRQLAETGADSLELGLDLPEQLQRLLRAVEAGEIAIRLNRDDLQILAAREGRHGRHIAVAVVLSGLLQAGAVLLSRERGGRGVRAVILRGRRGHAGSWRGRRAEKSP